MTPRAILRFDRVVGRPLCFFLTAIRRLRWMGWGQHSPEPPCRIIFVKLIEMGSTVLAMPAFAEAARKVGRNNIFILVFESNKAILDAVPLFPSENVLTVDDACLSSFVISMLRALRRIRAEGIDTAIDLEGLTRASAAITYLTGAKTRVGYHNYTSEGPYRGRLFTHELSYNFQHHVSQMFLAMVRAIEADTEQMPLLKERMPDVMSDIPRFVPSEKDIGRVTSLMRKAAGRDVSGPIVLLNSNCSDLLPLRRWPVERFVELGRRCLQAVSGLTIIVTGGPTETEAAAKLAAQIGAPGALSMAGQTTLRDILTLCTLSDVLVSSDSGPCHFAALTEIHIVALFGPETPELYGPIGKRVVNIRAGLACSPCVNMLNHRFSPCTDNRCMQAIGVDEVLNSVISGI